MGRVLQGAGVFVSFAFIVIGCASVVRRFDLISQPFPGMNDWRTYHFTLLSGSVEQFHFGWVLLAAGLTFLWFQRMNTK
jgi:hypothetical protein